MNAAGGDRNYIYKKVRDKYYVIMHYIDLYPQIDLLYHKAIYMHNNIFKSPATINYFNKSRVIAMIMHR